VGENFEIRLIAFYSECLHWSFEDYFKYHLNKMWRDSEWAIYFLVWE